MQDFFKKTFIIFIALALVTGALGYLCFINTFLTLSLLPDNRSSVPWHVESNTDELEGGRTRIRVNDTQFSLNFDFNLSRQAKYPYAGISMVFGPSTEQRQEMDFSRYNKALFNAKCSSSNMLSFSLATFDEGVSQKNDPTSYRIPGAFFSCNEDWRYISVDLTRLETPQWWFDRNKVDLSRRAYSLTSVSRIIFGNTFQSPFEVDTNVQITELTLVGRNWFYLYLFGGVFLLVWGGFAIWFFRQYTAVIIQDLNQKALRDRPLVAYQQLSIESHRDRDKRAILQYMATHYANAEVSLEAMEIAIGVSRTKINEILKSELGYTFTGYLNKLRLTETARLLSLDVNANIAEIAYSVGYKNVSYFNKLFKEEYGCTPKMYKSLIDRRQEAETENR